jgi:hypothetical protein
VHQHNILIHVAILKPVSRLSLFCYVLPFLTLYCCARCSSIPVNTKRDLGKALCTSTIYIHSCLPGLRLAQDFVVAAKRCLGVPVTPSTCNIGRCCDVTVTTDGQHIGKHCRRLINQRQTKVKVEHTTFPAEFHTSGKSSYNVSAEVDLLELGYALRPQAPVQNVTIKRTLY